MLICQTLIFKQKKILTRILKRIRKIENSRFEKNLEIADLAESPEAPSAAIVCSYSTALLVSVSISASTFGRLSSVISSFDRMKSLA